MRLFVCSLVALAMLAAGAAVAAPFVSRELGFQVEFPAPPRTQEGVVKTEFGPADPLHGRQILRQGGAQRAAL